MRKLSMLLPLCAAVLTVCVSAHPYSKIPDSIQLGDGFTSKKSSVSSSSNSYAQANQDNIEIDGAYNGQAFAGSKTSGYNTKGGSHSHSNAYSSASASGVIPIGLVSSSASSGAYVSTGGASGNGASQAGYGALQNPGTGFLGLEQGSANTGEIGYDHNAQDSTGQIHSFGGAATSGKAEYASQSGNANHAAGSQYWWNSQQSPFLVHGNSPSAGCTSTGCTASGSLHITNQGDAASAQAANQGGRVDVNLHGNPFLAQGHQQSVGGSSGASSGDSSYAFGSATATGFAASGHTESRMDVSKNPFLNGIGVVSGSSSHHGSVNHHNTASTSGHTADAQSNIVGTGNPFFGQQVPQIPSVASGSGSGSVFGQQIPQRPTISGGANSGNPFFSRPQVPQVPQVAQFPQYPQTSQVPQHQEQDSFDQQQVGGFPSFPAANNDQTVSHQQGAGLSVSCNGQDRICVTKNLCSIEGYVISNDIHQVRAGPQVCKVPSEVCCNLKGDAGDQSQAGSFGGHSTISTSFGSNYDHAGSKDGGIFGNSNVNHEHTDLSTGEIGGQQQEGLFGDSKNVNDNNGYLPPLGSEPSSNVPAFSKPPTGDDPENEGEPSDSRPSRIFPPAPAPPVQVGCAAALICVEEQFCTLGGVITPEPQAFTSEQIIRRVPLSSCKNPDNGVIGKCCRDPNYVDPWPAGNLPANYTGGFDEQGFPTFLNIAKTRPPKKQPPTSGGVKGGRPTKTAIPQYKPQINQVPRVPSVPPFTNVPNRIPNIGGPFQRPTVAPQLPQGIIEATPAPFPPFPALNPTPSRPSIVPGGFPSFPIISNRPNQQPGFPSLPNQQPGFPSLPNQQPGFPSLPNQQPGFPSLPNQQPGFPSLPNPQNPFANKNIIDTSSSNQNPTIIAPHVPGSHCGLKNQVRRPEGLTDVDVAFGEIPWQAMILSNQDRKLLCSGAIVAPNAILTAARCVEGFNANQVSIKTGEWKLGYELKHEEPLPFEIVNVASIVPHPGYTPGNPAHDVAILFLEHDVKLDQHVDMLCLPEGQPQPLRPGTKCISTGWGKTVLQVNVAGSLMHSIDVDVLSNDQCRQRLAGAESHIEIDDSLVCTKAHRQNNNMCQVDLGGPLACDRGDGYYELAGVYNQDTGCLPTNQVATFALIPTSWVHETLANPPQQQQHYIDETPSPTSGGTKQVIHNHGPNEPCDCQKSNLPSENNQYLPPQ